MRIIGNIFQDPSAPGNADTIRAIEKTVRDEGSVPVDNEWALIRIGFLVPMLRLGRLERWNRRYYQQGDLSRPGQFLGGLQDPSAGHD